MKNLASTPELQKSESEEINRIIHDQENFLKGLTLFTCVQFAILLTYYTI